MEHIKPLLVCADPGKDYSGLAPSQNLPWPLEVRQKPCVCYLGCPDHTGEEANSVFARTGHARSARPTQLPLEVPIRGALTTVLSWEEGGSSVDPNQADL